MSSFTKISTVTTKHRKLTLPKDSIHLKDSATYKGQTAEEIASLYLSHRGYTILQRNLYTPYGEIDILAKQNGEYVCVEVKSRTKSSDLPAELALSALKYSRLVKSMLSLSDIYNKPARIDVITVEGKRVRRHFKAVECPAE